MPKTRRTPTPSQDPIAEAEEKAARLEAAVERQKKAQAKLDALAQQEIDENAEAENGEQLPGGSLIEKVLAELDGEGSFTITRINDEGRSVNIGQYDLESWPAAMEAAVKSKGGGTYTTTFRDSSGMIVRKITRAFDPISAPATVASSSSDLVAVLTTMMKAAEDRAARAEQAQENARIEMARLQSENTKAMIEMFKSQNSGGPLKSAQDIVAIASLFKQPAKDPVEDLLNLKELMDGLKEDRPEPSGTMDKVLTALASTLLPAAAGVMAARRKHTPPPPPKPRPVTSSDPDPLAAPTDDAKRLGAQGDVPVAAPAVAVVPSSAETLSPEGQKVIPLGAFIENVVNAIKEGVTPDIAAEAVFDSCAEKGQDVLLKAAVDHGDWDSLKSDPRLSAHGEWVASFRSYLIALFASEEAELAGNEQD